MSLKATSNRIIVSPEPPVTQEGRFFIRNLLPANQGKVISVGPESEDVQVGQRISWKPFSGSEVEHEGVSYKVISPEDVLLLLDV